MVFHEIEENVAHLQVFVTPQGPQKVPRHYSGVTEINTGECFH